MPCTAPLQTLHEVMSATLLIDYQKNSVRGQVITQESTDDLSNPVAHLAEQVHHILSNGGKTSDLLCTYFDEKGWKCLVRDY